MNTRRQISSVVFLGMAACFIVVIGKFKRASEDTSFDRHFAFVEVESGEFLMGSPADEKGRKSNEVLHRVRITKPFQVAKTEVTQRLWKKVMGKLPKDVLKENDDLPVTYVSWDDVQVFLERLRRMRVGDGFEYRLPTEAEWEYVARGGHKTSGQEQRRTFPFSEAALDDYAWSWSNSKVGAQPVATRKANPLGLYDVQGNVWEWTVDKYAPDASALPVDPEFGHPVNLKGGPCRVLRGGCWTRNGEVMRSAFRGCLPDDADFGNLGVRLVRVAR